MSGSQTNEMKQIKGYPLYLGGILAASLSVEIFNFLYILLISYLENVSGRDSSSFLLHLIRICVFLMAGWGGTLFLRDFLKEKLRKKINDALKQKWLEQIFLKKGEALEKFGSGSFQYAFWKLGARVNCFYRIISIYISMAMIAVMAVYMIVKMNYKFLLFVVGLIFVMFLFQVLSGPLENKRRKVNDAEKKSVALTNNMFKGIDVVKNYGMEKPIHSGFMKNLEEIARKQCDEKKYELSLYVYNHIQVYRGGFLHKEYADHPEEAE